MLPKIEIRVVKRVLKFWGLGENKNSGSIIIFLNKKRLEYFFSLMFAEIRVRSKINELFGASEY